jgi:hypothetical protein
MQATEPSSGSMTLEARTARTAEHGHRTVSVVRSTCHLVGDAKVNELICRSAIGCCEARRPGAGTCGSNLMLVVQIDAGDDSIRRFIVRHHRYDPDRRRRHVVVAAVDGRGRLQTNAKSVA